MGKQYDDNGDVILTQDQRDLCRLAEYFYVALDELLVLEDRGLDLDQAVLVYRDAAEKLEKIIGCSQEETLRRYRVKND